ncbi:MAG: 4-hydroxy-tetrahydrodipicolinate synthase [Armatimonadota bacterium]|nr:4-hydroxy-tetrahydrodipicolinate synthase [Armatimonadota bacterium]MDR7532063.1 4-hydroxy-tetrahydrodipicolinate synthase [Armatimonadota bacterium]MDR7535994.1 4-hydroxy-tetrahydrodipicolinate synthase [Armatimonadota bacterium]
MSIVERLGRVIVPHVTPFDADGGIDEAALERLVGYLIERRMADSLFVGGTTGEFHVLTLDERARLLARVKALAGDRVPLVAGTGAAATRDAVVLTQEAERLGYDAVTVITPYYSRPTQDELFHYFAAVARATTLPVMLYNIPLFTGVNLAPETLERLAAFPNIVAVKDQASAHPVQASEYLRAAPRLHVYCGDDAMILQVLAQGGAGAVSGGAHVVGDLIRAMIQRFLAGQVAAATAGHLRLLPFHRTLTRHRTNPIPVLREAIRLATGIDVGPPRLPMRRPSPEEVAAVREALGALGRLASGE